ncbi:MAG: hypothetical protein E6J41_00555 [Chloroflexi bacterium]|nr:MAG: hypothetical protein E6J41_00555 [Chloroflexota bacterium]
MIPGGGGGLSFPNVDTGALRGTASWFGTASAICQADGSDLRATLASVGESHAQGVADLNRAGDALNQVSTTLITLANTIDDCRSRFHSAMDRMNTANTDAAAAQSAMDNYVPHGNGAAVSQFFDQQQTKLQDAQATAGVAQGDAARAIADALAAGQRAASALSGIAGMAGGIGNFAGTTPAGPAGSRGEAPPDTGFLVLLLGSVRDNQDAGAAFERFVLKLFGLTKNTEMVNGSIPDYMGGRGGQMIEIKGVAYQYNSSQIQNEMAAAAENEQSFTLIIGPKTRVSAPLRQAIEEHPYGGEIVRAQSDGTVTDYAGNPVTEAPNGGFMYTGKVPEGKGTLNNPRGFPPPEEVPPSGGGAGSGDLPPGETPEEPEVPELPELPLP